MGEYARMPELAHGFQGFHHTLDSALAILCDLGVAAARVTLRMAGRGYPTRWVVEQDPAPGEELHPGASIRLSIAGTGVFNALPIGMWEQGGEVEPGTREIVEVLDDPLQKAGLWLREGARLFDIQPGNPAACSRWIGLFGLNAEDWPEEMWYKLALILPSLHELAGKERGIRFALNFLLDLPLKEIRRSQTFQYFEANAVSRTGMCFSRLGVDAILGARVEDLARLTLLTGPVELRTYYDFTGDEKRKLLEAVLDLVCPCYQRRKLQWVVLDPTKPPRLGDELQNGRLGINSYLGGAGAQDGNGSGRAAERAAGAHAQNRRA